MEYMINSSTWSSKGKKGIKINGHLMEVGFYKLKSMKKYFIK